MKQFTVCAILFLLIVPLANQVLAQMEGAGLGGLDSGGTSRFRGSNDRGYEELLRGGQSYPWQSGTGNHFMEQNTGHKIELLCEGCTVDPGVEPLVDTTGQPIRKSSVVIRIPKTCFKKCGQALSWIDCVKCCEKSKPKEQNKCYE